MLNYKKLFQNKKLRIRLLIFFSWIPDKTMVKLQYWIKTGRILNLKNPTRFSEKLQWYKLYYKNPVMAQCADKYEVRKYVAQMGLSDILNQLCTETTYNNVDDIPFNLLPNQFVLKDTLGGGGDGVIIVKDKSKLDIHKTKKQLQDWLERYSKKHFGREWVYEKQKHRILVEKYISTAEYDDLIDYKFFCFYGNVEFLYVIKNHKMGFYDARFEPIEVYRTDCIKEYPVLEEKVNKPQDYTRMIEIAQKLSQNFPHVRVDLYNVEGKIIFGELTFFTGSGYTTFEPDEYDFIFGEKFDIANIQCIDC